jgi:hypothetical protein
MSEMHKHLDDPNNELDRTLDAALAKYAAAQPRAGLEDRVLANLRTHRSRVPDRTWWRWSVAGALAAMIVVAIALAWRSSKPSHPVVKLHPSPTLQSAQKPTTPVASTGVGKQMRGSQAGPRKLVAVRGTTVHRAQPEVVASASPRLDQFPSPRPLSEQEKILLDYVGRFPDEAARVADAQTALAQREELEMYGPPATRTKPSDHEKTE